MNLVLRPFFFFLIAARINLPAHRGFVCKLSPVYEKALEDGELRMSLGSLTLKGNYFPSDGASSSSEEAWALSDSENSG